MKNQNNKKKTRARPAKAQQQQQQIKIDSKHLFFLSRAEFVLRSSFYIFLILYVEFLQKKKTK